MTTDTYHHGDLANAMLRAVEDIVTEKGPAGISLREAARRAGVSHSAPAHHFGDKDGMIEAFCHEGFGMLAKALMDCLEQVSDQPVVEQLGAIGKAYLLFAAEHPAHYELMMSPPTQKIDHSDVHATAGDSFFPLVLVINRMAEEGVIEPERGPYFATMLWGMVHGIADLWLTGPLPKFHEGMAYEDLVEEVIRDMTTLVDPN